ncbi:hypothetical protein SELMODRAFT_419871 [Selaginella moellendorffii]|uniref:Uncharacterized protein n=1 Tax=Selaginella moellendorffii TaxID=88036 RepID=D8SAT5_SELML|nr:hypothetical protein SELMODRAFT_419871 [Selaginella moellendorffii]
MSFKTLSFYSAQQYIQVPDAPERKHQEVLPRKDRVMRHDNRELTNPKSVGDLFRGVPTNDKMDQSRVGLKNETLDRIMDKVLRGPTETKACFRDASSENQDRIYMGSLFPGFRYVIPQDRDMVAEVKGVTYLVVARENTGEVIVGDNGKPVLVEISADFQESHEIQYKKEDRRWSMAPEDIYQVGSSGCNKLLKELKSSHPIERPYCYVWAKEEYNYGILDIFGSVKVLNHTITPASVTSVLLKTDAYNFVQGFMRVHVGNEFLGWTPEVVENIYRQRLIEIRKEQREVLNSRYFERNLLLYLAELRTTTDLWDLQENAERYIITLNIPNFAVKQLEDAERVFVSEEEYSFVRGPACIADCVHDCRGRSEIRQGHEGGRMNGTQK